MRPARNSVDFPYHPGYTSPRNYPSNHLEEAADSRQRRQPVTWGVFDTVLSALPRDYARMKRRSVGIVDAL